MKRLFGLCVLAFFLTIVSCGISQGKANFEFELSSQDVIALCDYAARDGGGDDGSDGGASTGYTKILVQISNENFYASQFKTIDMSTFMSDENEYNTEEAMQENEKSFYDSIRFPFNDLNPGQYRIMVDFFYQDQEESEQDKLVLTGENEVELLKGDNTTVDVAMTSIEPECDCNFSFIFSYEEEGNLVNDYALLEDFTTSENFPPLYILGNEDGKLMIKKSVYLEDGQTSETPWYPLKSFDLILNEASHFSRGFKMEAFLQRAPGTAYTEPVNIGKNNSISLMEFIKENLEDTYSISINLSKQYLYNSIAYTLYTFLPPCMTIESLP